MIMDYYENMQFSLNTKRIVRIAKIAERQGSKNYSDLWLKHLVTKVFKQSVNPVAIVM